MILPESFGVGGLAGSGGNVADRGPSNAIQDPDNAEAITDPALGATGYITES